MLLPSDVARLVLGYLQEEGLCATSQTFIHESPNLKEYADHTTEDGTIPACVFSIFGKGLTTILNDYVAAKTKESHPEVPVMMTSLWKKLDLTLNQIKSMQNSPALSANQRTRTRMGLANMARQRVLTVASAGGVVCSTVSETISSISPTHTSFSTISHSTPVSYTTPHSRLALGSVTHQQISDGDRILNIPRDSPVNIVVAEHRLNPGPMSPGRRKWDTPRKRSAAVGGSSSVGRSAAAVSSLTAEPQPEEVIDENFPQLVIQNACDKILGDRSLQEKLAENINKILANEPTPQTLKPLSATVEPDQSIDEILGLQGEIHMSDDAIHDILEQTESDPAFQALFDLFDCNKGKFPHGEPGDGDVSNNPEESDAAGSSSTVELLQNNNPDTTQRDSTVSETTAATMKTRVGQDRKTRRSAAPTLLKKTFIPSSGRTSRIEGSSARLLVSQGEHQAAPSAAVNTDSKEGTSLFSDSISVTPMDIDEPLNTPPPPLDFVATSAPATKDNASTTTSLCESTKVPSSGASSAIYAPVVTAASIVDKNHEGKQASTDQPAAAHSIAPSSQPALLSLLQIEPNNTPRLTPDLSDMPVSAGEGNTPQVSAHTATAESCSSISVSSRFTVTAVPSLPPASTTTPFTATAGSQICSPASTALTPASFMPVSPASFFSCAPAAVAPAPPPTDLSTPSKAAADSSNMVSLKIIISDSQDEEAPNDMALNQAVSSISGDKIPTIYLSSPAKSPGMLPCPSTPKGNLDEVAQAVSGLQNSEVFASPLTRKTGALVASPLTGTSQAQQSYIIQVPLSTTNPVIQGATASYFLVTEPPAAETPTRQVLLPASVSPAQPLPTSQFGGITPTQGYSSGSTLILPSSVKPVMLPVSVMGQNSLGNVQMVSNQLVAIPNPVSVQQPEAVKPKQSTVPIKQSKTAGTEENLLSAENTSQQDAEKGSSHRRILCFDSSADVQPQSPKTTQTSTPLSTNTSTSVTVQQPETDNIGPSPRTKPAILGGNKPKRRIAIIRCPANPQSKGGLVKEADTFVTAQKQHKEMIKKNPRKQLHNTNNKESQSASISIVDSSKPETSKKLEVRRRSKSVDRKHSLGDDKTKAKTADIHSSKPSCSDSVPKSGTKNDKEESSREESAEKAPAKIICEGRTEKKTQEVPNVTANKENENKGSTQQHSTPTSPTSRDVSPPDISQPISSPQSKMTKAPSKTSSLVKQAAEMLQDIQGLNSPSTPVKGPGAGTPEPSLPRTPGTGTNQEQLTDCSRTPSRQKGKDGEETPRRIILPNTPDVPTCSPASEAGSENSINMAAHTLMILSRAAIARSGTPLKDSLRQEGAGEKSPSSSKNSKKRKQSPPSDSQPAKKESKPSPNRKKDREKKRLVDCFPHDLDVDKFLSSLHYDE